MAKNGRSAQIGCCSVLAGSFWSLSLLCCLEIAAE